MRQHRRWEYVTKCNYRFIDLDGVFTKKGEEVSLKFAEYLCDTAS